MAILFLKEYIEETYVFVLIYWDNILTFSEFENKVPKRND